jgi:hypothetical protein
MVLQATGETGMQPEQSTLLLADKHGRPGGEAREIYDQGGRYVSFIGWGLREFHMESDLPERCDSAVLLQLTEAMERILLLAVAAEQ